MLVGRHLIGGISSTSIRGAIATVILVLAALLAIAWAPSGELAWPLSLGALALALVGFALAIVRKLWHTAS